MKKSWLQITIGVFTLAFALLAFIGTTSRHISTLAGWFTYTRAGYITIVCAALTVIVLLLLRFRALPWKGNHGERLRIRKLNKAWYFALAVFVLACWATAFANDQLPTPGSAAAITRKTPPFDATLKGNKVLILPFLKQCEYLGKSYDIGYVIRERLEAMRTTDSIIIQTRYYVDSLDLRNFTAEMADSLMKSFGANQILYGSYSLSECEGKPADKICYNYRTDRESLHMDEEMLKHEYKILDFYGLDDIRHGAGMESIDYVIYSVSGTAQYWAGKLKSAVAHFKKIKDYQHKATALFGIGNCYMMIRNHAMARQYYQQALAIKPDYGEALAHSSLIALRENKPDSARLLIEQARKVSPDHPCVNWNLGDIRLLDKDTAQAVAAFRRVGDKYQSSDQALIALSKEFFRIKDYEDARTMLNQAVKLHPSHPGVWNLLGQLYYLLDDDESAIICFENALAFNPEDVKALHNKGLIHMRNDRYCEAMESFRQAITISPRMHEAWIALADCYRQQQLDELAVACLEEALTYDNRAETVLACAGNLYTSLGRFGEATVHYAALTRLRPSNVHYYELLAATYISQNNHLAALSCYERACRLSPRNGEIHYRMAQALCQLNRPDQAVAALGEAIALSPDLLPKARIDGAFRSLAGNKPFSLLVKHYSLAVRSFRETAAFHPPVAFPGRSTASISTTNRQSLFPIAHILLPSWQAQ